MLILRRVLGWGHPDTYSATPIWLLVLAGHGNFDGTAMTDNPRRVVRVVIVFVAITYAVTWGLVLAAYAAGESKFWISIGEFTLWTVSYRNALAIVSSLGPALAATLLTTIRGGRCGLVKLLSGLTHVRISLSNYFLAFAIPAGIGIAAILLTRMLGVRGLPQPNFVLWFEQFFVYGIAVMWEEIGWRGWLLQELLSSNNAVTAGLISGIIWGAWHIPYEVMVLPRLPGVDITKFLLIFLAQIISLSLILTWIFLRSGRSLLPPIILHASWNVVGLFFATPLVRKGYLHGMFSMAVVMWLLVFALWYRKHPRGTSTLATSA